MASPIEMLIAVKKLLSFHISCLLSGMNLYFKDVFELVTPELMRVIRLVASVIEYLPSWVALFDVSLMFMSRLH